MSDGERRPLIDRERIRRAFEEKREEFAAHPERARIVTRAKVRIVRDFRKEAQLGPFTITSDEHPPYGEGSAPSPLQYFVGAVGL